MTATAAAAFNWSAHWTYIFDRGYVSFDFLTLLLEAGAHFVIRFKAGINYCVEHSFAVPLAPASAGLSLLSDEHVTFPNWAGVILRLVSYQLPDGKVIRVLTDRFDLTALSVAQLYKERWTIENWWKWIKHLFKIKQPLGPQREYLAGTNRRGVYHRPPLAGLQTEQWL
jgi:IS4 transposase